MRVNIYSRYAQLMSTKDIIEVLMEIKNPSDTAIFKSLRDVYAADRKQEYDMRKKRLLAFTAAGTFKDSRKADNIDEYSQLMMLDFDDLSEQRLEVVGEAVRKDVHTFSSFISPSGRGLKVIAKVNSDASRHQTAFKYVSQYYEDLTGAEVDTSGKDVSRLCYFSYDPNLYINDKCVVFTIPSEPTGNWEATFVWCESLTKNRRVYQEGSRNEFVYLLACNCNRLGIPHDVAYEMISKDYNFDAKEVVKSVKSAYNNVAEFAKYASSASSAQPLLTFNSSEHEINSTPLIPNSVYQTLPDFLAYVCTLFDSERERDVFLTGALSVLSGCFDTVKGAYRNGIVHANLYSFIVAPAASGKGVIMYARQLGEALHRYLSQSNNTTLFIAGNSSAASIVTQLSEVGGRGIICETEADSLSNAIKQDWGNFDELLRKCFHHEPVTYSRKQNRERIEIRNPRLSIALSGTPSQVKTLIPSSENGLFSRFIFYAFSAPVEWKDVRPNNISIVAETFNQFSEQVLAVHHMLGEQEICIDLLPEQWDRLNQTFASRLSNVNLNFGGDAVSVVMRLGLVTLRIAMVLTILRHMPEPRFTGKMVCNSVDFNNALKLTEVYLEHSLFIFRQLPTSPSFNLQPNKQKFLDALPNVFTTAEAIAKGSQYAMRGRTVADALKLWTEKGLLERKGQGQYEKIQAAEPAGTAL